MQPVPAQATSPDNDIVVLLQGGEPERAFALLFERYEGKVYRLCCALLRDATHADDAAQESWVRVWKAPRKLRSTRFACHLDLRHHPQSLFDGHRAS